MKNNIKYLVENIFSEIDQLNNGQDYYNIDSLSLYTYQPRTHEELKEILKYELKVTKLYDLITNKDSFKNEFIFMVKK